MQDPRIAAIVQNLSMHDYPDYRHDPEWAAEVLALADEADRNADNVVAMVLGLLAEHIANEPPQDAGSHPSEDIHIEVGRKWREWSELRRGYELILSRRLIDRELSRLPQKDAS